ncbi:uncharacterized protein LOC117174993 [Belonocnema kinseyi]|uniref:uncharacterized protein LOC117174993 n=1 Tax=Belonocnema kinseyi TaxID=2817044 RepID=UPI00143D3EAD|nr:uncharacterized protein LOC117174993 [Belonocnema kinseyi]
MKCILFFVILEKLTIFQSFGHGISSECPKIISENEIVRLPHETECALYYSCRRGEKYLAVCPKIDHINRFHFNPSKQFCDWPEYTDCTSKNKFEIPPTISDANGKATKLATAAREPKTITTRSKAAEIELKPTTVDPQLSQYNKFQHL